MGSDVEKDCRLLKLSDDFCTYKPVGYLLKGSIYVVNKSWGALFSSVVRYYLYKDIVSFKTIVNDGVFTRTVGCDVVEVISKSSKGLKGALNLGHGVYVATKGLKGEDVAYYLSKLVDALGVDEKELYIIVSKKNNELNREEVKECLLNSAKEKNKTVKSDEDKNSSVVGCKDNIDAKGVSIAAISNNIVDCNGLYVDFKDVGVSASVSDKGVLCLTVISRESNVDKIISLDVTSDWRYYKPKAYSLRGSSFKDVHSWEALYLDVLSSFTVSTRDSDRLQALIEKGVFVYYDYSLISNKSLSKMRNSHHIGRGMYADNCFFNPNDMKNMLLLLFNELKETYSSLQIKVDKLNN